ncbi:MAG: cation:proton antiporter [Chloroflexi bacterium]|nr:cation:proton antiporter [Chloroflexota bacterium]
MEHNPALALFLALGIVITSARIAGGLARQFRQPRVLGELIVGVILGPTLLDLLHSSALGLDQAHVSETVSELAQLGVLLLMFKIGLDVHIAELMKVGKVALFAGLGGALLPVIMVYPIVRLTGIGWEAALFTGVILAATSVSISAQVLLELDVLQTKEGNALLAAALIDDVVAILLVSITVAITSPREGGLDAGVLLGIVGRMALYFVGAFMIAWFLIPRLINWMQTQPAIAHSYGIPAIALVLALLFGWSAEAWGGVAAISGAFIVGAGLSRAREPIKHTIDVAISNIAYTLLIPIFFVNVGLEIDLHLLPLSVLPLAALLLVLAFASKLIGCGAGALLGGFNRQESLRLGICMVSRGEVGLIIASLGASSGVFRSDDGLYGAVFLVILLSTVITPPLVRRVFQNHPVQKRGAAHAQS